MIYESAIEMSRHAVSGSLDGKLIVWDSYSTNKVREEEVRSLEIT